MKAILAHFTSEPTEARKAFIDAQNEHENTSLHWASMNGQLAAVKLLVVEGASTAIANGRNYIPLDLAALNNKTDVVDYFLSQSGNIEAGNSSGLSGSAEGIDLGDGGEGSGKPS